MTSSNKINILRVDHVVGLSQASIEINVGFKIYLGGCDLPSLNPTLLGNPKFQSSRIPFLTADSKSAEKTVN